MWKPFTTFSLDAVENATLSKDFINGKKIRPIIFSHGNMDCPNHYSGMLMDFAARGYIVFAQFHEDGTCAYTEKLDGTVMHITTGFGVG